VKIIQVTPSWHTTIQLGGGLPSGIAPVFYLSETILVSVRELPDGTKAYLPRFVARFALSHTEAHQAVLDKLWTWNDREWGGEAIELPSRIAERWMMAWVSDLHILSAQGLLEYRYYTSVTEGWRAESYPS